MIPRFHAPAARPGVAEVELPAEEAHHLAHVMRLRAGATIRVFDGRGREWLARVVEVGKRRVRIAMGDEQVAVADPAVHVTLAIGILKSEAMERAVRDAVMVGVGAVQPLVTAHSVARLTGPERVGSRWARVAVASAKQCGRATVPEIREARTFDAWLESARDSGAVKVILAEPALAVDQRRPHSRFDFDAAVSMAHREGALVMAGPEGGWSANELEAAHAAGFIAWTVNARVLRAEAIPVAALSILLYEWDLGLG